MKIRLKFWLSVIVSLCLFGFMLGCPSPSADITDNNREVSRSSIVLDECETIGTPDSPLTVALIAAKTVDIGTVEVWLDGDYLYARYKTDWMLKETHFEVVTSQEEFPQTEKGNPKPGQFTYKTLHDPPVSNYTYQVPLENFGDSEVLYFAAHAAVEEEVDGECLDCESAWADGFDFPGANWATFFIGALPPPVDLTGYWDIRFTIGGEGQGPHLLFIKQTGSDLECTQGFSGTLDGKDIFLETWMEEDDDSGNGDDENGEEPEMVYVTLSGTFDNGQITGIITWGETEGTFILVPSEVPFGHFDLSGNVEGDVSLDTEYGFARDVSCRTTYHIWFATAINGTPYWFRIETSSTSPGEYILTDGEGDDDPEDLWARVTLYDFYNNEYIANEGYMQFSVYDSNIISVPGFSIIFPGNYPGENMLEGNFVLDFITSQGALTLNSSSSWNGMPLLTYQGILTSFGQEERTRTSFDIIYRGLDAEYWIFVNVPDEILPGTTYDFSSGAEIGFFWLIDGEGDEIRFENPEGELYIENFSPDGIKGSFDITSPYILEGSFDVGIYEGEG